MPRSLSISNLAWPPEADVDALALVASLGFDGIELAPSKVFGDLAVVTTDTLRSYRRRAEDLGLVIPALQAILFGASDAHLFSDVEARNKMAERLRRVAEIAEVLGAHACVFGAPALRDPGDLAIDEADAITDEFMRSIAPDYAAHRVKLCVEANPTDYGCRYVTRSEDAFRLVKRVAQPGIAMQFDTGTLFINGEDPASIRRFDDVIGHFHVSEPALAPIGTSGVDHEPVARELISSKYDGWISIEMKHVPGWRESIATAHDLVKRTYCTT